MDSKASGSLAVLCRVADQGRFVGVEVDVGTRDEQLTARPEPTFIGATRCPPTGPVPTVPCAACGQPDTVCVHASSVGGSQGYTLDEEFHCAACGWYTVRVVDWDS